MTFDPNAPFPTATKQLTQLARSNPPDQIGVGSQVILNGQIFSDSYGNGPGTTYSNRTMFVTFIAEGRATPYNVGTVLGQYLGWVAESSVRLA